ncbi:hypothetical protein [Streptomyces canus]|uniref:hypothetical protein n=1 Tax=Streptomyces canus TaxID=58343 RepID=UPI0036E6BD49
MPAAEDSVSGRQTGLFAATWRARDSTCRYRCRDLCADPVHALGRRTPPSGRRVERAGFVPPDRVPALHDTVSGTGESLLRDTRVVMVTARGGGYGPGTPREPYDLRTPYLKAHFGELGVRRLHFVAAELAWPVWRGSRPTPSRKPATAS